MINWSLNQLDMLLFIKIKCYNNRIARETRRKFLARGGTKVFMGGTQIFLDQIFVWDLETSTGDEG